MIKQLNYGILLSVTLSPPGFIFPPPLIINLSHPLATPARPSHTHRTRLNGSVWWCHINSLAGWGGQVIYRGPPYRHNKLAVNTITASTLFMALSLSVALFGRLDGHSCFSLLYSASWSDSLAMINARRNPSSSTFSQLFFSNYLSSFFSPSFISKHCYQW